MKIGKITNDIPNPGAIRGVWKKHFPLMQIDDSFAVYPEGKPCIEDLKFDHEGNPVNVPDGYVYIVSKATWPSCCWRCRCSGGCAC